MDVIEVRQAKFEDYEQLCSLMTQYNLATKPFEEWKHLWQANPAIEDPKTDWPLGWTLFNRQTNKIVGFVGNLPIEYSLNQKKIIAGTACEWVVEKDFRKYNPLLSKVFFEQSTPQLLLNTTAISSTGRIFSEFGGSRCPVPDYDISLFWITEPSGFANSFLKNRGSKMAWFSKYPLSAGLRLLAKVKTINSPKGSTKYEYLTSFGNEFDLFWNELKNTSKKLLAKRDRNTLDWHFKYALQRSQLWIMVKREKTRIISYALFFRQDTPAFDLKRIRLVDFQTLEQTDSTLTEMIAQALGRCKSEKIHMLEVVGFENRKREAIKMLNPFSRKLPAWMFFYKATDNELKTQLPDSDVWDPCSFDGDGSL